MAESLYNRGLILTDQLVNSGALDLMSGTFWSQQVIATGERNLLLEGFSRARYLYWLEDLLTRVQGTSENPNVFQQLAANHREKMQISALALRFGKHPDYQLSRGVAVVTDGYLGTPSIYVSHPQYGWTTFEGLVLPSNERTDYELADLVGKLNLAARRSQLMRDDRLKYRGNGTRTIKFDGPNQVDIDARLLGNYSGFAKWIK